MITHFSDYTNNNKDIDPPIDIVEQTLQEYIGTFERRVFILESYWEPNIFNSMSVYPFISNLGNLITDDIVVGHRFFDSSESLLSYIKYPDGKIWQFPETYGTSVFMFESHANSQGLTLPLNDVSKDVLIDNCRGFHQSPNILVFGGCELFHGEEGKEFGSTLARESGSKGVFGFTGPELTFVAGTFTEMLLLTHFFIYKGNPFENLTEIYENVLRDFPLAATKEVGLTLFLG